LDICFYYYFITTLLLLAILTEILRLFGLDVDEKDRVVRIDMNKEIQRFQEQPRLQHSKEKKPLSSPVYHQISARKCSSSWHPAIA